MGFVAQPLFSGDLYEAAAKLARAAEVGRTDAAGRVAAQGRQWRQAMALGWPVIVVPETSGGLGGSLTDLVALVDGAAGQAPVLPLASLCGVVPALLTAAPVAARWLIDDMASGTECVTPILDAIGEWSVNPDPPSAKRDAAGSVVLCGTASGVETIVETTTYLLPCPFEGEAALLAVPARALAAPRQFLRMDGRLAVDLSLTGVVLPAEAVLAVGEAVERWAAAALELGAALTCVEVVACIGGALGCTIAYLSERKQFGVALSTMQALRHKVAELYISYETSRALVAALLGAMAEGPASRAVALTKARIGAVARQAAETVIQLHGGMGLTEELPATRFNKRLLMAEFDYGDTAWHIRQALQEA